MVVVQHGHVESLRGGQLILALKWVFILDHFHDANFFFIWSGHDVVQPYCTWYEFSQIIFSIEVFHLFFFHCDKKKGLSFLMH